MSTFAEHDLTRTVGRLPRIYAAAFSAIAMQNAKLHGTATISDLAAALDLPPEPPATERRIWSSIIERIDAPSASPLGDTCAELITGAEVRRDRERSHIIPWSAFDRAGAADAEWHRLDALRPAAAAAVELVRAAGPYAEDAWLASASEDEMRDRAQDLAALWSVPLTRRAANENREPTPDELRRKCPAAQRRLMRRRAAVVRQFWSAALQLTGGRQSQGLPRFCDNYTMSRWRERQERAEAFGRCCKFVRGDGVEVMAADIMAASAVANLNRLYVQMRGIEDLAEQVGLGAAMITLTLPPEYHPNPSQGARSWAPEFAPAQADRELQRLWANLRARLKRLKITTLGLRVVEAHTDGCPHIHAVLFANDEQLSKIDAALRAVRPDEWDELPGDDEGEKTRKAAIRADRVARGLKLRVATDLKKIDRARGRPSTYALAYILKAMNVDPKKAWKAKGLDEETKAAAEQAAMLAEIDDDGIRDYDRHRAWSSERHQRRYSILGGHGMQRIWQRLHRLKPHTEDEREQETLAAVRAHPAIGAGYAAIQRKDWAAALRALGAVKLPGDDEDAGRACLRYESETIDPTTGEVRPLLNLYGEQIRRPAAIGWTNDPTVHIRLKDHSWKMVRPEKAVAKSLKTMARTVAVNDPRGSADGTDPGRQERENVIALRPQPPPRRSRGSMLSMIEDYSHAA